MKESVSTSEIFKYVLLFTLLFAAFLTLAINYNRIFKIKNETITIIEKYDGVSTTSLKIINNYLNKSAYKAKGKCDLDDFGVSSLTDPLIEKITNTNKNKEYYYCINYYCSKGVCSINTNDNYLYYKIKLFYKFNLPFVGDLLSFKINGETKGIRLKNINQLLK